ncbi:VENN motif pre-toxin domain-containing protein, partial [Photorhabdus heterorhabditis]|uniref:VENN motif pre-toxin domain-containing protein n=1 Tax=Photorhabdus heterorhabditis TaxID=880156 RepID=UPI001BD400A7
AKVSELTEEQKQTISTLSTLAAGLAGGIAGDSTASAVTGAQAGKNAVDNNALASVLAAAEANKKGTVEKWQQDKQTEIQKACSGNTPLSCQTMVAAEGSVLALPWLSGASATTGLIGAVANTGIQYLANGNVDPNDAIFAYWTGAFTANTGLWGTIAWNAGMGAASSYVKGDDPLKGGMISGAASGIGYGVGKLAQNPLEKFINPNWKNYEWVNVGIGISKPLPLSSLPGVAGNIVSSVSTEFSNDQINKEVSKIEGEHK